MERAEFDQRLAAASAEAVVLARRFVREELRGEVSYFVVPNQSSDREPDPDQRVFPEESLPEGAAHGPWTREQVVGFLWREGRVPEWIDVSVERAPEVGGVDVELRCCGRFTATERRHYHQQGPYPPFHVLSPAFPPLWREGDPPFELNARRARSADADRRARQVVRGARVPGRGAPAAGDAEPS